MVGLLGVVEGDGVVFSGSSREDRPRTFAPVLGAICRVRTTFTQMKQPLYGRRRECGYTERNTHLLR